VASDILLPSQTFAIHFSKLKALKYHKEHLRGGGRRVPSSKPAIVRPCPPKKNQKIKQANNRKVSQRNVLRFFAQLNSIGCFFWEHLSVERSVGKAPRTSAHQHLLGSLVSADH
jgi:hypothetical protein